MIHWESHACLPLHPQASFAPIDRLHAAGVGYVSINVGMDMNPVQQALSVIAGFRATIAAHPGRYRLVHRVADSSQPVIFSHANPLALVAHGRNISDAKIRACAATGGVVCVSGVSFFLGTTTPTAADVARHVAYVADLVGVQHVGIGLDISFHQPELNDDPPSNYIPGYWWPKSAGYDRSICPAKYTPLETWQVLAQALHGVGMGTDAAALVMGGHMLRIAGQVWG